MKDIKNLIDEQRKFFQNGKTFSVEFRVEMLKKLYKAIKEHETEIKEDLKKDLGKSFFEGYMCEIGLALTEISYMIKKTPKLAKGKRVRTPLAQFAAKSFSKPSPYGNTLIISPWNYPFLLTIGPLVDAIAAGDTAIIKPSEFSVNTSAVIEKIVRECFPSEYVAVVLGGVEVSEELLKHKFDFVFFTGSPRVGRIVLQATAKYVTPTVLELGGKSPCIVDDSAKIKLAAKRIVFGKQLNCGQTCVAPDYVLCDKKIKDELIREIIYEIKIQYGEKVLENRDYGKIITKRHFDRVKSLINKEKVVFGGEINEQRLQIEPTIMDNVTWEDEIMQEEIFGPILPILTYDSFDEILPKMQQLSKPLALYIFSENKRHINEITTRCAFGGGCVNDTIIHLATNNLGFGGVGESGMGAYHGKAGFYAFSYTKGIVDKKTWMDLPMRYQPYKNKFYEKLIRFFLK